MTDYDDLYRAIMERRSVRRFEQRSLDDGTLDLVRAIANETKPLVPTNRWEPQVRNVDSRQSLVEMLGGYGYVISPPHVLLPVLYGTEYALQDLGYRAEQVAVRLVQMGIASCFVGALPREDEMRAQFGLPGEARIGAALVFGWPGESLAARAANRLMSSIAGAPRKRPLEQLFYTDRFEPGEPPDWLSLLLEAARRAPSAVNAQPWRFLWQNEVLYLFCEARPIKYGDGVGADYRWHDSGAAMANITLAMEALGQEGEWVMMDEGDLDVPDHPDNLEIVARLILS